MNLTALFLRLREPVETKKPLQSLRRSLEIFAETWRTSAKLREPWRTTPHLSKPWRTLANLKVADLHGAVQNSIDLCANFYMLRDH